MPGTRRLYVTVAVVLSTMANELPVRRGLREKVRRHYTNQLLASVSLWITAHSLPFLTTFSAWPRRRVTMTTTSKANLALVCHKAMYELHVHVPVHVQVGLGWGGMA